MKKKSVPNVKEQKPKSETSPQPDPLQVANKEEASTVDAEKVAETMPKLIEIPQVDEDTKKMLVKAGVNWDSVVAGFERVNVWAESVDARFKLIGDALEKIPTVEGIAEELNKRLLAAAEKQRQQLIQAGVNPQAAQDSGGLSLLQMLPSLLGGGGSDSFFTEMGKRWMEKKLASDDFGDFMAKEMFKRIMPEAMQAYEQELLKKAQEKAAKEGGAK